MIGFNSRTYSQTGTIINKSDGFVWHLVTVYGTSYPKLRTDFIVELHDIMENASCPVCMGGDFNLVSGVNDKNNGNINNRSAFLVNKMGLYGYFYF